MNNPLLAWLSENLTRLFEKSPKFFLIWQWIAGFVAAISGLPLLLHELNIDLPDPFQALTDKTVAYCALAALFMSKLSVRGNIEEVNSETGKVLKSNPDKLPFTERADQKQLLKEAEKKAEADDFQS